MKGIEVPLDHQRICPSYGTPGGNPPPPVSSPPANTPQPWGNAPPSTNNYPSGHGQGYGHGYGNGYPSAGAPAASSPKVIDSDYHYGDRTNHIDTSDVNIGDDAVAVTADSEGDDCD
jgi:iron transport multicopper oxidase